jgi:hypothetical protein
MDVPSAVMRGWPVRASRKAGRVVGLRASWIDFPEVALLVMSQAVSRSSDEPGVSGALSRETEAWPFSRDFCHGPRRRMFHATEGREAVF